jgi:hypothetical protein
VLKVEFEKLLKTMAGKAYALKGAAAIYKQT